MAIVNISGKYRVKIDPMNHTLERLTEGGKTPKTGEDCGPRWTVEGYFPNMRQCVQRVVDLEISVDDGAYSLEEYVHRLGGLSDYWANVSILACEVNEND